MSADEKDNRGSGGVSGLLASWPALAIVASVLGLLIGHQGFELARPPSANKADAGAVGDLRVDSRSWQDPYQGISLSAVLDRANGGKELDESSSAAIRKLAAKLAEHAKQDGRVAIMAVLVSGSPFPSGVESRLRNRLVVQSAMRAAGYVRTGSDSIRYFLLPAEDPGRWLAPDFELSRAGLRLDSQSVVVPYEWFHTDGTLAQESGPYKAVLALWLKEGDLRREPFLRLASLLSRLCVEGGQDSGCLSTNYVDLAIVGPRSSDGLLAMIRDHSLAEAETNGWMSRKGVSNAVELVRAARIISTAATAPDAFFLDKSCNPASNCLDARIRVGLAISNNLPHSRFEQFGCTDERLCFLLLGELATRRIDPTTNTIILLSEYDTFYGRALPLTFKAALKTLEQEPTKYPLKDHDARKLFEVLQHTDTPDYRALLAGFETNLQDLRTNSEACARGVPNIRHYTFLAGMDGSKTFLDNPKKPDAGQEKAASQDSLDTLDRPEGDQQLDYMRRLADELGGNFEDLFKNSHKATEVAAVGLLGGDFYDKLIILQGLRGRLRNALFFTTDLDARMNLHSQHRWTKNVITAAPFDLRVPPEVTPLRISPFRDTYQTALFLGCLSFLGCRDDLPRERLGLFEIGRETPHRLRLEQPADALGKLLDLGAWKQRLRLLPEYVGKAPSLCAGIGGFALVVVATFMPVRRSLYCSPWLLGAGAVAWALGSAAVIYLLFASGLEPLEIGDGVSALSSAVLLCLAVGMGLLGLVRAHHVDAELRHPTNHVAFVLGMFAILVATVLLLLDTPLPFRGGVTLYRTLFITAWCCGGVLTLAIVFFWVVFYKRLQILLRKIGDSRFRATAGYLSLSAQIRRAYRFGEETEKCDKVLIYPTIVLLLLILASSPWTASWNWTPWMILLIGLDILLLVLFQVMLNRAAGAVRSKLMQRLRDEQLGLARTGDTGAAIQPLQDLVAGIGQGCFAPLAKQPVFGALAGVLGGSGIVSLLQPLLSGHW